MLKRNYRTIIAFLVVVLISHILSGTPIYAQNSSSKNSSPQWNLVEKEIGKKGELRTGLY